MNDKIFLTMKKKELGQIKKNNFFDIFFWVKNIYFMEKKVYNTK